MYERQSRTTAALEAYNGALGKRIKHKGCFYAFAKILQSEENEKLTTFKLLIESAGGAVTCRNRGVSIKIFNIVIFYCFFHRFFYFFFQTRDDKIRDATKAYKENRLTPLEFLTRVIFKISFKHHVDFDGVSNNEEENIVVELKLDEGIEDDENNDDTNGAVGSNRLRQKCTICLTARLSVLFTVCKHLVACDDCYRILLGKKSAYTMKVLLLEDTTTMSCWMFKRHRCSK